MSDNANRVEGEHGDNASRVSSAAIPPGWKTTAPPAPVMDWPEAWRFIREEHPDHAEHHPSCSWVQTNGALLCDCDVLWDEYVRRGGDDPRV